MRSLCYSLGWSIGTELLCRPTSHQIPHPVLSIFLDKGSFSAQPGICDNKPALTRGNLIDWRALSSTPRGMHKFFMCDFGT